MYINYMCVYNPHVCIVVYIYIVVHPRLHMYKSLTYIKRITHLISSRLLTLNFVGWPRPRAFSAMTTKFMCMCVCGCMCMCV